MTQKARADWSFVRLETQGSGTRQQGTTAPTVTPLKYTTFVNGRYFDSNPIDNWIKGVGASIELGGQIRAVFQWQSFGMP
jgi:hypothetical protein